MRFVLVTMPFRAHLNPTLGVARELIKNKHEVIVYNTAKFSTEIKKIGAECRTPITEVPDFQAEIGKDSFRLIQLLISAATRVLPPLIDQIERDEPDCIIHDSLNVWGKVAATMAGVARVCLVPTLVLTPKLLMTASKYLYADYLNFICRPGDVFQMIGDYQRLYLDNQLKPPWIRDVFVNREALNIVFTSRHFQPGGEDFDEDYQFVGPIIYDRGEKKGLKIEKSNKQIIFISLGTIYNNEIDFYRKWIAFFRESDYQVYMSVGDRVDKKNLGKLPKNVIVGDYLPQLEILEKAGLFISHGGMNSVNESLFFGVPMLLFPQIHEQKINSARVEELGAGFWYKKKELDRTSMREMIDMLMNDDRYREKAMVVGRELKEAGGAIRAVKVILDYLNQIGS